MNTYFLSKFTTTLPLSVNGMDVVALFNTMSRGFCLLTPDEWQRVRELLGSPTDDQTLLSLYGNGVLIAEDADEESAIKL